MNYQRGEVQSKLEQRQSEEAVELARLGCWEEAIVVNQGIIEATPGDISAYNRLGKALVELGKIDKAIDAYSNSLKLEPNNSIAMKNLARLRERLGIKEEDLSNVTKQMLQRVNESMTEPQVEAEAIAEKSNTEEDTFEEEKETLPDGFFSFD